MTWALWRGDIEHHSPKGAAQKAMLEAGTTVVMWTRRSCQAVAHEADNGDEVFHYVNKAAQMAQSMDRVEGV